MKTTVVRVVLLAAIISVISCGKDKKTITGNSTENTTEVIEQVASTVDLNKSDTQAEVTFKDAAVQGIYTQYLAIKAALVNSNSTLVQEEAEKLEALITLTEETKQLKATTNLIAHTKGLNKQRDFFVTVTDEVEKMISASEIISGEVYKQFCPMAFDGQGGYWLSDSKEVRNPYYGDKMLKCGEVKSTIK